MTAAATTSGIAPLLTEAEAAALLKICPRTLRKARQAGQLPWVQIGRKVLYAESDLAQFIQEKRQCPSISAPAARSGGTRSPGTVFDFEQARKQRTSARPD